MLSIEAESAAASDLAAGAGVQTLEGNGSAAAEPAGFVSVQTPRSPLGVVGAGSGGAGGGGSVADAGSLQLLLSDKVGRRHVPLHLLQMRLLLQL